MSKLPGTHVRLEGDVVINPFSWNTVVFRNDGYYSAKQYPPTVSQITGHSLPERFQFKHELVRRAHWTRLKLDHRDYGIEFDCQGYAK